METMITITIQTIIQHGTEEEYERKSEELVRELEERFDFVDVQSEDNCDCYEEDELDAEWDDEY